MIKELYIISLEDLIPNAFIELNQRSEEKVFKIPMIVLEKYGDEVARKLKSEGKRIGFCYSRDSIEHIKLKYRDYFCIEENYKTVNLKSGIDLNYMIETFRTRMEFELLLAYMDEDVVKKGLIDNMNQTIEEKDFQKKIIK